MGSCTKWSFTVFSTPVMGLLGVVILGVGSLEFGFWVVGVVFSWCVSTSPLEDPIVLRNLASDARASGGSLPPPPPPVPKGGGGTYHHPPPPQQKTGSQAYINSRPSGTGPTAAEPTSTPPTGTLHHRKYPKTEPDPAPHPPPIEQ